MVTNQTKSEKTEDPTPKSWKTSHKTREFAKSQEGQTRGFVLLMVTLMIRLFGPHQCSYHWRAAARLFVQCGMLFPLDRGAIGRLVGCKPGRDPCTALGSPILLLVLAAALGQIWVQTQTWFGR